MKNSMRKIVAFISDEEAAAGMEYALLLAMAALMIVIAMASLTPKISRVFTSVDSAMVAP